MHKSKETTPDISQLMVNVDGIFNLLYKIEFNKAGSPDEIPPRFLKETAHQMAPLLTFIFQSSLNQDKLWNQLILYLSITKEIEQNHQIIDPYLWLGLVAQYSHNLFFYLYSLFQLQHLKH